MAERSQAILSAYIELVAETSDPSVALREIADRSGVSRTAIAHFVGSRDELVAQAISELARRYELRLRKMVGTTPMIDDLLDALFDDRWNDQRSIDDVAFDILGQLTDRYPATQLAVRDAYRLLVDELAGAVQRRHPDIGTDHARGAAYAITCLAEFHPFLRQIGVEAPSPDTPRDTAAAIIAALPSRGRSSRTL